MAGLRCPPQYQGGATESRGPEGELDIIAYNPQNKNLVHLEPSIDGHSWDVRTERFEKKFRAGRKYVREVFPWIDEEVELDQIAVLVTSGGGSRTELVGGKLRTIDEIVAECLAGSIISRTVTISSSVVSGVKEASPSCGQTHA